MQKKKICNVYVDLDVAEREFFSDLRVLKLKLVKYIAICQL